MENGLHINRPSSTRVKYKLRRAFDRKYYDYGHISRRSAVVKALKILENDKGCLFVEVYRVVLADYYDPNVTLVCKIKNI